MKFKTHQEIDEYLLQKEFIAYRLSLEMAVRNVKRKKFLWGIFYNEFIAFGILKQEVQEEWSKLK